MHVVSCNLFSSIVRAAVFHGFIAMIFNRYELIAVTYKTIDMQCNFIAKMTQSCVLPHAPCPIPLKIKPVKKST